MTEIPPSIAFAALPLVVVIGVNLIMSALVLPSLDTSFLGEARWGEHHSRLLEAFGPS
jgi:hypothetical protein